MTTPTRECRYCGKRRPIDRMIRISSMNGDTYFHASCLAEYRVGETIRVT